MLGGLDHLVVAEVDADVAECGGAAAVSRPGDLAQVVVEAGTADKATLYMELGLRLTTPNRTSSERR